MLVVFDFMFPTFLVISLAVSFEACGLTWSCEGIRDQKAGSKIEILTSNLWRPSTPNRSTAIRLTEVWGRRAPLKSPNWSTVCRLTEVCHTKPEHGDPAYGPGSGLL